MTYTVLVERAVQEELRRLGPGPKRSIKAALSALAEREGPAELWPSVKRLDPPSGIPPIFRLRIGDYRAVFVLRPPQIRVLKVFHRDAGYEWMKELRLD